jgi:hypothetical protein
VADDRAAMDMGATRAGSSVVRAGCLLIIPARHERWSKSHY